MTSSLSIPVIVAPEALRAKIQDWRARGLKVALVPTMGALHEGHLTLVRRGLEQADRVVVSIFVNPTQFAPNEDFDAYPRRLDDDVALLSQAGASLVHAPTVETMYPQGFATRITVGGVSEGLCGVSRPGHFAGVATVVAKLLLRVLPDVALFGEKDYQQLQVIRRLALDLDIPVRIQGVATVREADGLALSSRNAYLSAAERAAAPALFRILSAMAENMAQGAGIAGQEEWGRRQIEAAGFGSIDYLETRHPDSLARLERLDGPGRILAAAHLGRTRLIDNVPVPSLNG
ncbi:MAG: pantoate--beta-alanine ligase [Rhodospirillaceae bacterium]|nr:pantoate--beta-alanine ligase [Rhodospirillaceae bacterium]